MTRNRTHRHASAVAAASLTVLALTTAACVGGPEERAPVVPPVQATDAQGAPIFQVDPFWPKPLPNKWSMQQVVDIYVDSDDHVWAINRSVDARPDEVGAGGTSPRTDCCVVGPSIVHFDSEGNVVDAWGGPDHHPGWPGRLQTIGVDREKNVYVSGTRPGDSIIKFASDGTFLWDLVTAVPEFRPHR